MTPEEIKEWRKRLELSCEKFGHLIGVSGGTISRWEKGRASPSPLAVVRMKQLMIQSDLPKAPNGRI